MNIVVLDGFTLNPGDNPWTELETLGNLVVYDRTAPSEIVSRAAEADVLLTNKTPLLGETLRSLPKLRLIAVLATGYNIVDVQTAGTLGIPVSNVPEYGTDSVAQHVFAMVLHFAHHGALHDQLIRQGEWQRRGDFCFWQSPLRELAGQCMGIVGFGRIGRRVGELAHAFGMHVVAHDVHGDQPPNYTPFAWMSLESLFEQSDVVTLHCPLTSSNAGLVNQSRLALMKPTALLINAARGGLVNEQDLAAALNQGRLAGAALDVLSTEPPAADNPLLQARNCLLTPHVAWATLESRRRMMAITVENVRALLRGSPINVVNQA